MFDNLARHNLETHSLEDLGQNQSGATTVLFAVSLPPLMAIAALAIDMGSLYLGERRLQNVADAAAAASVSRDNDLSAQTAVAQIIDDSGLSNVAVYHLTDGEYLRDPAIHFSDRYDTSSLQPNASRVVLRQEVPLFFGSLLTGSNTTFVTAEATASRLDMAGFMLGTRLLALDGGLAGSLLSSLSGVDLGLTAQDIDRLQNTTIDVLDFAQSLGPLNALEDENFGEILDADTPLHLAVEAMADAAPDPATAETLNNIASMVNGDFLTVSDLIDLGPLRTSDVNDGVSGVAVDSFSLLRALLQASHGESYEASINTSVAGLANVTVKLAGGNSEERSPWLTVDTASEVTLRTSETRLYVNARTAAIAGLPSAINLPIYAELASAEAQMTDIVCNAGDGSEGVYIDARPSIGTLAIADVDMNHFDDFSSPMWLEPATLVSALVLKVDAYANIDIGGDQVTTLHFTPEDVKQRRSKSANTTDPLSGIASSLVSDVELDVNALGLGLGLGNVASLVGTTLGTVAPSLDVLITQLTDVLGVKLGNADVTVDRLRCGIPSIVG